LNIKHSSTGILLPLILTILKERRNKMKDFLKMALRVAAITLLIGCLMFIGNLINYGG